MAPSANAVNLSEDALNSSLRTCANDPDFAMICAFLQKFSKDMGIDVPNFKSMEEWLTNTEEVSSTIRDLHITLLRKSRRVVHEKSWEVAVYRFCLTYSSHDALEIKAFSYKNSSLKVKLRLLRELLENQFEYNIKLRAKILSLTADSLRSEPIGRDRHGYSYWLTQDNDCNVRIYQEHLDEEVWQVVATNREEFVNLIARLRENKVILPSTNIGIVDEDSTVLAENQPTFGEEEDDSQEEVNLKVNLNAVGKKKVKEHVPKKNNVKKPKTLINSSEKHIFSVSEKKVKAASSRTTRNTRKKRNMDDMDKSSSTPELQQSAKKTRHLVMDSKCVKKQRKYVRAAANDEAENCENKENADYDENNGPIVGSAIEDPVVVIRGAGSGKECDASNLVKSLKNMETFLNGYNLEEVDSIVGEAIEEDTIFVIGSGYGALCSIGTSSTLSTEPSAVETKKKAKKKRPGKDGSWSSGSEEEEEPEEEDEDEEPVHEESDSSSLLFKSDHEFSPESDFENESQVVPMKRARTARKEDAGVGELPAVEEEACQKCSKSDHPEWILLCDKCDKGYHCSCLSPVLFYIPEGDWYCPPCQQQHLIVELENRLKKFDALVEQKRIAEKEEKQRSERKQERKSKFKRGKNYNGGDHDDDNNNSSISSIRDTYNLANAKKYKRPYCKESSGRNKKGDLDNKAVRMSRTDRRSRREAAKRCDRQLRQNDYGSSDSDSGSESGDISERTSSSASDSDFDPKKDII